MKLGPQAIFPLRFSDGTISLRIFRESHRVSEESLKIFAMKEIAKGNEGIGDG